MNGENEIMKLKPILIGLITAAAIALPAHAQLIYGLAINGGGIVGTKTNDSAPAGNVGELLTTQVAAAGAVAGAASTASANVTSVSLTAGDWIVQGTCSLIWTGVTATVQRCGLGTTTDVQASQAGGSGIGTDPLTVIIGTFGTTLSGTTALSTPVARVSVASTTTIYLVAGMTYSAGSFTQYGSIRAWRVR